MSFKNFIFLFVIFINFKLLTEKPLASEFQPGAIDEVHYESRHEKIIICVNSPYQISIQPNVPIYIQDRILKVRSSNKNTFLVGKSKGQTLIKIGETSFDVFILSKSMYENYLAFKNTFKDHPSIKISYDSNGPVLSGEILLEQDIIEIINWAETSDSKPRFNLKFQNEELKKIALDLISNKIGAQVTDIDDSLQISLMKKPDSLELKKINNMGLKLTNLTNDGLELGVLDIQFISVSESEIKSLSPILPTAFQWTIDDKIRALSQLINSDYSQTNNIGRKSSKINLAIFENEKTDYHSGGEFAIQQQSLYRNEVQWKTFGLFVEATPLSLSKDEIRLDIKVKMSYLTASNMDQPSLNQDRWHQKLRLQKNKTIIVSNTLTNIFTKNKKNHLFFKSIPILSSLFYGKTQGEDESNIYMLIRLNSVGQNQ